ncbi:uncharacterized protein LOC142330034 isoform X1 [Lycorma delicatula]|uniref:uncharacterized protein LOC142330034 isoform X1 n=1 Tax=Lycorma delicatula TaxID=130591 RepID=UPI003F519DA2
MKDLMMFMVVLMFFQINFIMCKPQQAAQQPEEQQFDQDLEVLQQNPQPEIPQQIAEKSPEPVNQELNATPPQPQAMPHHHHHNQQQQQQQHQQQQQYVKKARILHHGQKSATAVPTSASQQKSSDSSTLTSVNDRKPEKESYFRRLIKKSFCLFGYLEPLEKRSCDFYCYNNWFRYGHCVKGECVCHI